MQRRVDISIGEYYHIYNRSVERKQIFFEDAHYIRFQKMLYMCNNTKPVAYKLLQGVPLDGCKREELLTSIGAYVIMPNHFHILAREIVPGGISMFMEKLLTGYSMFFNKRYERVGAVFQRPFRAKHVTGDEYLKYLFAYIHLNPLALFDPEWKTCEVADRRGAKDYLDTYRWSSYPDYTGEKREENGILTPICFPGYFEETSVFDTFINEWISYAYDSKGCP